MKKDDKNTKTEKVPKYLIIIIACVVLFIIIGIIGSSSGENTSKSSASNDIKTTTKTPTTTTATLSESDKMIIALADLIDEGLVYDTGDYVQGDIPAGEYAFVKLSNFGSYYSEEDMSGEIIDNENFASFGYVQVHGIGNITTDGVLVSVNAFDRLGVTGAKQLYEIINEQNNYNQSGYYKVGVDIPSGTYTVESIGRGYYAILTGPISNNDIVDNDNFNGTSRITLRDGQYLELSRAQILY